MLSGANFLIPRLLRNFSCCKVLILSLLSRRVPFLNGLEGNWGNPGQHLKDLLVKYRFLYGCAAKLIESHLGGAHSQKYYAPEVGNDLHVVEV